LLISGIVPHPDGTESFVHADGYVKALVKYKHTSCGDDFVTYNQVLEKTRLCLFFFGLKIPIGPSVGDSFFTKHNSFLETEKILIPVGIITEYSAQFSENPDATDDETKDKIALWDSACYVNEILDYCIVKDSFVTKNGNNIVFNGECQREIGKLQEIYVKNDDKK